MFICSLIQNYKIDYQYNSILATKNNTKKNDIILDQQLIENDKLVRKFWNNNKMECSRNLWLPIETDNINSLSNWSKILWNKIESNSWFSIKKSIPIDENLLKKNNKLCKSIFIKPSDKKDINQKIIKQIQDLNDKHFTNEQKIKLINKVKNSYENKIRMQTNIKNKQILEKKMIERINSINNKDKHPFVMSKIKSLQKKVNKKIKVKKIKVYLNSNQKKIFKQWSGTTRYIYNKILDKINKKVEKINFEQLRNKYIPKNNMEINNFWMLDVPKEVRTEAIRDLCKAYTSTRSLLKSGKINHFKMNFRSKKDNGQSFVIPHSAIKMEGNNLYLYKGLLKENSKIRINKREKLPNIEFDCRIKLIKPNVCYIYIPYSTNEIKSIENQNTKIISLDPGIKIFQTGYSPNGHVIKIGEDCVSRIIRLGILIDKLKSIINSDLVRCRKRIRIVKKINKLRLKIRNLKDDLHWKVIHHLCENYNVIIIPKFEVSKMVNRKTRHLKSKYVRSLLNLNHSEFKNKLIEKSLDYKNCNVMVSNESYTSKTCTNCGYVKDKLTNKKRIYRCPVCCLSINRDLNGARNILLRALVARPINEL